MPTVIQDADESGGGEPNGNVATIEYKTTPVEIHNGARQLTYEAFAGDTHTISAAVIEFANTAAAPDADWIAAATAGYTVRGAIIALNLSTSPRRIVAEAPATIYHAFGRLRYTVGASDIADLKIRALL